MFKILGSDGKEYGPVSADALRQWVQQGRANGQTPIQPTGATDWKPLASFPEFAPIFAAPPPGMTAAIGGTPIGNAPTSGLAISSLVMGILGFATCGLSAILTAPLGLIFGFMGMSRIKSSDGRLKGHGIALAGVIVSGVSVVTLFIGAALLLPALAKAKTKAQSINCMNNLKQLSLSVRIYSSDNNDVNPIATNWCDLIMANAGTPRLFICPGDTAQLQSGYAYNSKLSGLSNEISADVVMLFESDAGWNASGGKELMITKPRHGKTYNIAFGDGHVETVSQAKLQQLRWDPPTNSNSNPNP